MSLLPSKGVEFAPFEIRAIQQIPKPRYSNVFLERNQSFTTSFGSIGFFCLAISGLLIVSNSVQFKTDYLAYLSPIYPGSKVPKSDSVLSIQFFSRYLPFLWLQIVSNYFILYIYIIYYLYREW